MRDKKSEERVVASFLLKKVAPEALSYLEDGPEEPDFLTKLGRKKLGVEVRSLRDDLISGSHVLAATEGTQDSVVARAQKIYESRKLPAAQVYVVWRPSASCRVNTRAASEALVDAVAPTLTVPLPACGFASAVVDSPKFPDAGIVRLRVYRTAKTSCGSWFSLRGGWGTPCPPMPSKGLSTTRRPKCGPTGRRRVRCGWP